MEKCKEIFNQTFGSLKEQINLVEHEDLLCSYIQYLISESNTKRKNKGFFDYGALVKDKGKKFVFLWGNKPLVHLVTNPRQIEDILKNFNIEGFTPSHYPVFSVLEAGASILRDKDLLSEFMALRKKCYPYEKNGRDANSIISSLTEIIERNPRVLGFDGCIELKENVFESLPEPQFAKILFDWLYNRLKSKFDVEIYGKHGVDLVVKDSNLPFGEHDLIFLIKCDDGRKIVLNIEMKFGKSKDPLQILRQHLYLNEKFFSEAEVHSIGFNLKYNDSDQFKSTDFIKDKIKPDKLIYYLFKKHFDSIEKIKFCNSSFIFDLKSELEINEIKNQDVLVEKANRHMDELFNMISNLISVKCQIT